MICSNRCTKEYPYLQSFTEDDWKVVRDPITDKCSKVTIERFLCQPAYAFLFSWFATVREGRKFSIEEFKKKNGKDVVMKMFQEMTSMGAQARQFLDIMAS